MSCVYTLLGLLVVAFLLGPCVLALVQYSRQRQASARMTEIEGELARLRARLEREPAAVVASAQPEVLGLAPAVVAPGVPPLEVTAAIPLPAPVASAAASVADAMASPVEAMAAMGEGAGTVEGAFDVVTSAAAPPDATPPAPPGGAEPPAASPPAPRIEWERWIGVRGAAVLGGIVLALAGILFVRYTIERGLISPAVRITMGILTGLASIAWSQRLRSRGYRINADALAGAGIVLLYAAVWAAHSLYGFVGAGVAYGLMSLITVACGLLSWRNASLLIAVLGLTGGFATPFLLASSQDSPIGLFGYVLLLDLGLIGLARRRGWSSLALLALGGTLFYQAFWIFTRMRADGALLGLSVVGVFALVFGLVGRGRHRRDEEAPSLGWLAAETAGLLVPFGFALYFASRADLGPRLYPVAALLLMLSIAAQWVGRRHRIDREQGGGDVLSAGAAAGSLAVVAVWSWDVVFTPSLVWETVAICVVLAAVFHLFFELDARRAAVRPDISSLVAVVGFFALLVLNSLDAIRSPWPWALGWVLIAAMMERQSIDPRRTAMPMIAAGGVGAAFAGWFLVARSQPAATAPELYLGVALVLGAAFQLLAVARRSAAARLFSEIGAAIYPAILLIALMIDAGRPSIEAGLFLASSLLLALLIVLAVTRLGSGEGYLMGMFLLAFTHTVWSMTDEARGAATLGLVVLTLTAAAFALWPSLAPSLARSRAAWRAAALAAPFWFWPLHRLFVARFGDRAIGLLPILLAAITLGAAYRGRRSWAGEDGAARTSHLAWFGAIVLGLAAIAVPLQLDKEWITVGWALEGLAVTALWRRLDHPGLKYFGVALFAAVAARLLFNPEVLTYHDREGLPVLNWLAYTYLVPAACLLGAARILGRAAPDGVGGAGGEAAAEVARARPWEGALYSSLKPVLAASLALGAILVIFAWINLTILDAFASGPTLTLSIDRLPARDLTLSIAWLVYAVTLLGFGMARDSGALRWLSLGFLVLTIGKVFLYDLGELKDLYRVASLVGLAFSLILVSLAYQRFVFRRAPADEAG